MLVRDTCLLQLSCDLFGFQLPGRFDSRLVAESWNRKVDRKKSVSCRKCRCLELHFDGFFKVFLRCFEVFGRCRGQLLHRLAEQEDGLSFLRFQLQKDTVSTWGVNSVQKTYKKQKHSMAFTCSFCSSKVKQLNLHLNYTSLHRPWTASFILCSCNFFSSLASFSLGDSRREQNRFRSSDLAFMECILHGAHSSLVSNKCPLSSFSPLLAFFWLLLFVVFLLHAWDKGRVPTNCAKMLLPKGYILKKMKK